MAMHQGKTMGEHTKSEIQEESLQQNVRPVTKTVRKQILGIQTSPSMEFLLQQSEQTKTIGFL